VELDATRMCELLSGLPAVTVLAVDDCPGQPLRVHIETRGDRPGCAGCGGRVVVKDRPVVKLVDLDCFGRPARLVWRKIRWACPSRPCPVGSWTEQAPTIAAARLVMASPTGTSSPPSHPAEIRSAA